VISVSFHNFKKTYKKSLNHAWSDWIEFEYNWQHKNLLKIAENPVTVGEKITDKILGSVSKSLL